MNYLNNKHDRIEQEKKINQRNTRKETSPLQHEQTDQRRLTRGNRAASDRDVGEPSI